MGLDLEELSIRLAEACGSANVSRAPKDLAAAGAPTQLRAYLVRPGAAAEIAEVLRLCTALGVAVVPFGTASRKRAPREGARALVVLDMKRMFHVLHLDETSLIVHAQAGITGNALEELLLPRGLTLGDFPPAVMRSTLGGMLAVRTPGKSSPRHGFLEDAVLGVSAVLADGRTIHTRVAPRRATGPDLARLMLGSEGRLGVIASLVLRIQRRAETRVLEAYKLPSLPAALAAVHHALGREARPGALRILDADEARAYLAPDACAHGEAVIVAAFAGVPALVQVERQLLADAVRTRGGAASEVALAEIWWRRRTGHALGSPAPPPPSLEFSASSGRLALVYDAISRAAWAAGRRARAHISRFDADGAVLFVTLLDGDRVDPQGPARDPVIAAALAAGAHAPHSLDPTLSPYFDAIKTALDPHSTLG